MKKMRLIGALCALAMMLPSVPVAASSAAQQGIPIETVLNTPRVPTSGNTSLSRDGKLFAFTVCDAAKISEQDKHSTNPKDPHREFTPTGVHAWYVGCGVWITDTSSGHQRKLTGNDNAWCPTFSPDGTHLAFYSDRDRKARIWIWSRQSGQMRRAGATPVHPNGDERPAWSPDGRHILTLFVPHDMSFEESVTSVSAGQIANSAWRYPGATVHVFHANAPRNSRASASTRSLGGMLTDPTSQAELGWLDVATGQVRRLSGHIADSWYGLSPDGTHVALSTHRPVANMVENFTVRSISVADGSSKTIGTNLLGEFGIPQWSPDSSTVAITVACPLNPSASVFGTHVMFAKADRSSTHVSDCLHFEHFNDPVAWDPAGTGVYIPAARRIGPKRILESDIVFVREADRSVRYHNVGSNGIPYRGFLKGDGPDRLLIRDGKWLYPNYDKDWNAVLLGFDPHSGTLTRLWRDHVAFGASLIGWYGAEDVRASADGRTIVAYLMSATAPPDYYAFTNGVLSHPHRITSIVPKLYGYNYSTNKLISWQSRDGSTLSGLLILPAGYVPGKRYPLIVQNYPDGNFAQSVNAFGGSFLGGADNAALFTTRGYAFLWASSVVHPNGTEMKDVANSIVPAVQKVINMGIADPNGIGVMGGSQGGYGVMALVVQTHIFRAGVVEDGFADLVGISGTLEGDEPTGDAAGAAITAGWGDKLNATLWQKPQRYLKNSPILYLNKCTTPIMVLHGSEDTRVPVEFGRQIYSSLMQLGIETELRQYDGEGHGIHSFRNAADKIYAEIAWFDKHLKRQAP